MHRLLDRGHADAEATRETFDGLLLVPAPQKAEPCQATEDLNRRVCPNAENREERLAGTITAQEHDSGPERAEGRPRVERAAVTVRGAGRALDPGQRTKELHLPVSFGAGDPEDLALGHLEIDGAETISLQTGDLEEHLPLAHE